LGQVQNISFKNFRNFQSCKLSFNANFNILYGLNGSGKTNILEAISLLGKGRGFRNANLSSLSYKNTESFIINSEYKYNTNLYNLKVYSQVKEEKYKKIISVNNESSKDAENFIYTSISFLFFLPEMERLFLTSPNYRRNFIDKLIFSENKNYNKLINKYKINILERSKILQSINYDSNWIDAIEKQISGLAVEIYNSRNKQYEILNQNINMINNSKKYPFSIFLKNIDKFQNEYDNEESFKKSLKDNREFDKKFGGSKIGPHKSDFVTVINNKVSASDLSTGQQKTLVLMLLLAQCSHLIHSKKTKPILLFDEICSHLDETNRNLLLEFSDQFDIQLFLTGTEKSMFSFISTNANLYNITDI
tara:strand:- start:1205 stop:2293 length:1089 start_codon:yes stop_codon:yes gene_type:complete